MSRLIQVLEFDSRSARVGYRRFSARFDVRTSVIEPGSFMAATINSERREGGGAKCLIGRRTCGGRGIPKHEKHSRRRSSERALSEERSRGPDGHARTRFHGRPKRSKWNVAERASESRRRSLEGGLLVDALNPVNRGHPGQKLNGLRSRVRSKLVLERPRSGPGRKKRKNESKLPSSSSSPSSTPHVGPARARS